MNATNHDWVESYVGAITVCDSAGIILEMNDKAAENFREEGGRKLIGTNLFECHPEPSKTRLKQIMEKRETNIYTIEKKGVKKLIHQAPWYVNGEYRGFIELSLEVPREPPHFIRDP